MASITVKMKQLLLIRHAKSSWKFPELDDHERPLNKRGQRDILAMGRHLADKDPQLDVIYSSTATRALDYAQILSEYTYASLIPDLSFYTFSDFELLEILKNLPDNADSVAVVAHNPAITQVVNQLCASNISNVPTSAIVSVDCDIASWQELDSSFCELVYFDYPKMLK